MRNTCAATVIVALLAAAAVADKKVEEAVAKAAEQLQKGKTEEALKTLQKVVSQQPTSAEAHLALGRLQERIGGAENLEAAAASVAKAVELSPASAPARAEALVALASLDLLRGTGRDALAHAQEAVNLQPTPGNLALLARARIRTQDLKGGVEVAERAVQAGAASGAAHEARGEALLALRRTGEAIAAFRKALEADPRFNRARMGLAAALVTQGKGSEAVAEASKATETDPTAAEAFAVLGLAILTEDPKKWNEAIEKAQEGAFLNPRSPLVQLAVGKIFEAADRLDEASAAYRKATEVDPGYVPARLALVQIQIRRGDLEGALKEAQRIVAEVPQSGEAHLRLGEILLRRDDYAESVASLEKAVELAPGTAEAHYYLGRAYHFTGRLKEAVEGYGRATELAPQNVDYRTTYGLLLGITGQHGAGIAELQKVIATPGYRGVAAHANLGWIYRNMSPKKTAESIAAYKKALEIDPKNEQAALGLGWAYSYTRMWDEAIAAFKRAEELEPKMAGEAYNGMAWCYYFKKDMPQARAHLEKAQSAGRNDLRLKENIERIEKLLAAGEAAKSAEEIEKAEVEEGPNLGALARDLNSKDPNVRRRAARELAGVGREAVPFLLYAAVNDREWSVREQAVQSLGALGPAAREAIPTLKQIVFAERTMKIGATKAEMEEEARVENFRRLAREALQRIEGK